MPLGAPVNFCAARILGAPPWAPERLVAFSSWKAFSNQPEILRRIEKLWPQKLKAECCGLLLSENFRRREVGKAQGSGDLCGYRRVILEQRDIGSQAVASA